MGVVCCHEAWRYFLSWCLEMFAAMEPGDMVGVCCYGVWRYGRCLLWWVLEIWKVFTVMGPGDMRGVSCHGVCRYWRCLL